MIKIKAKLVQNLHWYHWLVISASLLLTLIAWKVSDNQIQLKRTELFKIQTEQLLAQVSERMSHYEVALKAGAAAIQAYAEETQSKDWKLFSETLNLADTYPGINGVGIIYYVLENERSAFIKQQKVQRPDFTIHPPHDNKEYWPITFIEPVQENKQAVGLDMAFEKNRFHAAKKARDTATTQITAPIVLVQDAKKTPGFLQYIPFYRSTNIKTLEQRRKHFVGHVYAPFIMSKLMEGTLKQSNRQLAFSISDGNDFLYNELSPNNSYYDKESLYQKEVTIEMFGRPWTFKIQTALSFKISTHSSQPLIILGSGLVIDTLLLIIFITLSRSQKDAVDVAKKITQKLRVKEEYYRHVIESAPCGIIITNQEGYIEKINPQTEILFGYSRSELVGKKVDTLIPERFRHQHPEYRKRFNVNPSQRKMGLNRDVFALTRSGNEFPAEIGLAQFKDGENIKTLATVIDISEYVQITKELQRSNRELNDFAYVASHDLKAPLRGIMQLSSWIEEDIADFANEDTKSNLSLLMNRTSRLENLLEDLLAYSRIGRKIGNIQPVNVKEIVMNIFDLQNPTEDISLICDKNLPEIKTYLTPLETIFRNLISNAIKHKNKEKLVIRVSCNEDEKHYFFSIEDNGSGIPEQHHQQIFELFKTLKPRDEVEGSGMGLSIIKKLLDYQNCVINVASDGRSGTSFTFSWPK